MVVVAAAVTALMAAGLLVHSTSVAVPLLTGRSRGGHDSTGEVVTAFYEPEEGGDAAPVVSVPPEAAIAYSFKQLPQSSRYEVPPPMSPPRTLIDHLREHLLTKIPVVLPSERRANWTEGRLLEVGAVADVYGGGASGISSDAVAAQVPGLRTLRDAAHGIAQEVHARAVAQAALDGELLQVPARAMAPRGCNDIDGETCEWEVVNHGPVNVRMAMSIHSGILRHEQEGTTIVGQRAAGDWLRLAGGDGFMKITFQGLTLLKLRDNLWYEKILQGMCADNGHYPVLNAGACALAAQTLGLTGVGPYDRSPVLVIQDEALGPAPEGCYMDATGALHVNLNPSNIGNGVVGSLQPICATMPYHSTKTSTTTRTTTTTSTTTTSFTTTSTTQTVTRTRGFPSLLCFSHMRPGTGEEWLVRTQLKHGIGIFECDDYVVISSSKVAIGHDKYTKSEVFTWVNPPTSNAIGNLAMPGVTTNSWLNTLTFIEAFDTIISDKSGRVWEADFLVKVDPDAVFLPDRLRKHVINYVGQAVFFNNCLNGGTAKLYGALEIYSQEAMQLYNKSSTWECRNKLDWSGWGEDLYMSTCMARLGARGVSDFQLVGDSRCMYAPCTDPWRAAFHPFKDAGSWLNCWNQTTHVFF